MKISIIQNCLNGEKYLKKSLSSIENQTYKNFELIFFDNCSTDRSKEIFEKFNNPRFKYYKSEKKLKLYDARNLAISKSQGDYITFLDVDDWWSPNKLEKQINLFKYNSTIDLIYTNYYIFNQFLKLKKKFSSKILPSGIIFDSLIKKYNIGILTVMIKSKIFFYDNIWFDPNFTILGDFDFFLRLSKNKNIKYLNECLAYYRNHNLNYSVINFKEEQDEFNYFIEKKEIKNILNPDQIKTLKFNFQKNKNKSLYLVKLNNELNFLKSKNFSFKNIILILIIYLKKILFRFGFY